MKKLLLSGVLTALVVSIFAQVQIGLTKYDLQTNNANARRLVMEPTGETVATYTRSAMSSFADRGTGYNYSANSGATWSTTTFGSFTRPDLDRTGWPNPVFTNTKEVIVSHFAGGSETGLQVMRRDIGTTGPWSIQVLDATSSTNPTNSSLADAATWSRAVSKGDSIFVITALADANMPGMTGGLQMYRSIDAGATWDGPNDIPLINSSNFARIGGDDYAIDMNDNGKIAIVLGGFQVEVLTSSDWGATFTKQTVVEINDINGVPAPLFSSQSGETMDTVNLSDGSFSITVDDNDKVHVWFGRVNAYKSDVSSTQYSYFPASVGLVYWNDAMTEGQIIHESRLAAQQVGITFPMFTTAVFTNGTQLDHYGQTYTSMPSTSYDDNGNIYVAYSSLVAGTSDDISDPNSISLNNVDAQGNHYRDIFVLKSADNGATWVGPINISNAALEECVYPSVPRKIYGTDLPVMWQQDTLTGINLQGVAHTVVDNKIMFVNTPTASIITPTDITAPTLFILEAGVNVVDAFDGCDINFSLIYETDDVPMGPNVLDYQIVNPAIITGPGSYTIDVYVVDDAGNSSDTAETIVTVLADNTAPVVNLVGPATIDMINGATYTDPGIEVTDNACDPSSAPVITTDLDENTDGTYTYTYTVTDNSGNVTTISRTVNVISTDVTDPVITANGSLTESIEACSNYTDPGVTAFDNIDYDVTASVSTTGAVDASTPGVYTITYSVTDAAGNTGTLVRTVEVKDETAPEIAINNTASSLIVCIGGTFVADATATDCVDANVTLTNDANIVIDNTTAGEYEVTFTAVDNSNNSSTETVTVKVGAAPVPDFTITSDEGDQVVTVSDASTGNPTSWIWNWNDQNNTANSVGQNSLHPYTTSGEYTIELTVSNIFVNACGASPESLKATKTVSVTVGIAELNKLNAAVSVFPNPSNGIINVAIDEADLTDVKVSVYNVIGDLISSESIANTSSNTNTIFDLGNDAAGIYFVTISTEGATLTKKVMVK